MKVFSLLSSLLLSSLLIFPTPGLGQSLPLRRQKAVEAQEALLGLNFFHEGRGMILPPGFPPLSAENPLTRASLALMTKKLRNDFGVHIRSGRVTGFSQVTYKGFRIGVVGCAMCHSGRVAGIFVPGLGNKNFDLGQLALSSKSYLGFFEKVSDGDPWNRDPETRRFMAANSKHFLDNVSHPELVNQTQGLVPIGLIRKWFFDNENIPMDHMARGQVKIPALWGYGEKRKIGSFSDGFGNGVKPGWAVAVELVAGQTPEGVRAYQHRLEEAEGRLADLLPPAYPFEIDLARARRGQQLFQTKCSSCHGTYQRDPEGLPIFEQPRFIPWLQVRTDAERLLGVTPFFRELVSRNPLKDLIEATSLGTEFEGYLAPRLVGIWSRFPYLHNGSVPTLFDLLVEPEKRPKIFSLQDAGERHRFDPKKLGLRSAPLSGNPRWIYDTTKLEHGNGGHYWPNLFSDLSDENRFELIEYLKTL